MDIVVSPDEERSTVELAGAYTLGELIAFNVPSVSDTEVWNKNFKQAIFNITCWGPRTLADCIYIVNKSINVLKILALGLQEKK